MKLIGDEIVAEPTEEEKKHIIKARRRGVVTGLMAMAAGLLAFTMLSDDLHLWADDILLNSLTLGIASGLVVKNVSKKRSMKKHKIIDRKKEKDKSKLGTVSLATSAASMALIYITGASILWVPAIAGAATFATRKIYKKLKNKEKAEKSL